MYIDISRCGRYVVSGNNNGIISIWDTYEESKALECDEFSVLKPIQFFLGHNDCVNGISLHPTYPLLCSSSGQRKFPDLLSEDEDGMFSSGASGNRVLCEVDAENYLQTEGLNIHQCAKKIRALLTVSEVKREEFVDDALICAKSLREELEISFELPRPIRRKHIFGDGSKDVQLSYEDYLRRTMFSSKNIRGRFQQLQNQAQKYAF
ncbi:uncharacterized protein TNCV_958211 [Trichonephila clavipes]|nr:uncharacterized protein TNCV_958211 [Trichonephila clavipes]